MKNKAKFVCWLVLGIMIGSLTVAMANQAIQAFLNTEIKVTLNGEEVNFTDEKTGETQYPITYNNRTYLPLRSLSYLLETDVDYDNATKTAILRSDKYLTSYKSFDDVIEKTREVVQPNSHMFAQYLEVNFPEITEALSGDALYYAYIDLNDDDEDDLIIYNNATYEIYGVFVESGGKIYAPIVGWTRNQYYLREGNLFSNMGSSGAMDTEYKIGRIYMYWFDELLEVHLTDIEGDLLNDATKDFEKILEKHPIIKLEGKKI